MTQDKPYDADTMATLACDIGARPTGAPGFDDVAGAIRAIRREAAALILDYDPAAADQVEALVAAERLCCPEIGWHLQGSLPADATVAEAPPEALRLRIEASPAQLDVIQDLFAGAKDVTQRR